MYSLDVKHKKIGFFKSIALMAGLVLAVLVCMFIAWLVREIIPQAQYISFVAVFALALYVMHRFVMEYRYTIREDMLYVERLNGGRTKPLWNCRLTGAGYYTPGDEPADAEKTYRFVLRTNPLAERVLAVETEGKITLVHIHVDEKLDSLIKQAVMMKEPPQD